MEKPKFITLAYHVIDMKNCQWLINVSTHNKIAILKDALIRNMLDEFVILSELLGPHLILEGKSSAIIDELIDEIIQTIHLT